MKNYKIFIDESGGPHANHKSKYFILVGCIIEDTKQPELKTRADQIKYKHWGKTNVVFHSEELGKRVGEFAQFATDPNAAKSFEKELLNFINTSPIFVCASIIDKAKAYRIGWNEETIVRKAAESIMEDFLRFLYGNNNAHGRIVFESSGVLRDTFYLRSFNKFLDPQWERLNATFTHVRKHMTSITFANKLNHDTEMQLADLLSYGVSCKFMKDKSLKQFPADSYEENLIKVVEHKILKMDSTVSKEPKKSFYSKIKGLGYFPKKNLKTSKITPKQNSKNTPKKKRTA